MHNACNTMCIMHVTRVCQSATVMASQEQLANFRTLLSETLTRYSLIPRLLTFTDCEEHRQAKQKYAHDHLCQWDSAALSTTNMNKHSRRMRMIIYANMTQQHLPS